MQVLLAQPRGFCAGVTRAIAIVERALAIYGAPIYVRHEIVHNRTVVEGLRARGAIFVDQLSDVPEGATVVFLPTAYPNPLPEKPKSEGCASLMPHVPSSLKCIKKWGACVERAA